MAIIVILLVLGVLLCVILASQSNNGGELGKRLQEIEHLEAALKKAPNSFRAKTIKEDIEYLKAKN